MSRSSVKIMGIQCSSLRHCLGAFSVTKILVPRECKVAIYLRG